MTTPLQQLLSQDVVDELEALATKNSQSVEDVERGLLQQNQQQS